MSKHVQNYEMADFFDDVPSTDPLVTNGKNQKRAKPAELVGYAQTQPNTLAEVAAGAGKAVDFGSLSKLVTNRSLGGDGIANTDGSFGHFSKPTALSADGVTPTVVPLGEEGGSFNLSSTSSSGEFTIGSGETGQIMYISAGSPTAQPIVLSGEFRGALMRVVGGSHVSTAGDLNLLIRPYEELIIIYRFGFWFIHSWTKALKFGSGWHENEDGTVTIDPTPSPLNLAAYPAFTVAPTVLDGSNGMSMALGGQY